MANILHGIDLTIEDGEGSPSESPWQICAFYLLWEWRLRYLLQCPTYSVVPRGLRGKAISKTFECWTWGVDILILSLSGGDSSLLYLKVGETVLSVWIEDSLLSQFLCHSPMLLFPLWEWLGVGLGPIRWRRSSSFLQRRSSYLLQWRSSFLLTSRCRANTWSLSLSISLSLLDWDGLTSLVDDLSLYRGMQFPDCTLTKVASNSPCVPQTVCTYAHGLIPLRCSDERSG